MADLRPTIPPEDTSGKKKPPERFRSRTSIVHPDGLYFWRKAAIFVPMTEPISIETRKGLPAHLRVLADRYPRAEWRGHMNFNDLTSFWLERHLMFRQVLDKVIGDTQAHLDGKATRYGPELSRYTGFFLNQLHGHHQIEDQHYFPQFMAMDARLEQAFEILDADHHALDHHLNSLADHTNLVLRALQQGQTARDEAGRLLAAQEGFKTFLDRHLMDEEEIIVPIVLEYGAEMS
jgi:iron-sulfur cluster repair protein YtfE (RIC family)